MRTMTKYGHAAGMALLLSLASVGCGGDGEDGAQGARGDDGDDGRDGTDGDDGTDGVDGDDGQDGADGDDGADGSSCSVQDLGNGEKLITCEDGSSVSIHDGQDARDAASNANGRLIFGDDVERGVRVLDLATGRVIATFADVDARANLYTTETGRVAAAVQGGRHRVDFFDTGLEVTESNGNRSEVEHLPAALDFALVGENLDAVTPIHFVSHHGYVSLHFDGRYDAMNAMSHVEAKNFIVAEADILDPNGDITLELTTEPQHGVGLVDARGIVVLSAPSTDRARSTSPNGFLFYGLDGSLLQTIQDGEEYTESCWGLHGETTVGDNILYGCHEALDGGVMVLRWDNDAGHYTSRKISYPGYPNAEKRTSILASHPASDYAVGQWGAFTTSSQYTGLVRIDPNASAIVDADIVDVGAVYCDFAFERRDGEHVVALTRAGRVHSIHVPSWSRHKTHQLFASSDTACAGRMVVGEGVAYVTQPETGSIVEIDVATLEVTRTFHVGGRPWNATLADHWAPQHAD